MKNKERLKHRTSNQLDSLYIKLNILDVLRDEGYFGLDGKPKEDVSVDDINSFIKDEFGIEKDFMFQSEDEMKNFIFTIKENCLKLAKLIQ